MVTVPALLHRLRGTSLSYGRPVLDLGRWGIPVNLIAVVTTSTPSWSSSTAKPTTCTCWSHIRPPWRSPSWGTDSTAKPGRSERLAPPGDKQDGLTPH
jgi:hypothetical protein